MAAATRLSASVRKGASITPLLVTRLRARLVPRSRFNYCVQPHPPPGAPPGSPPAVLLSTTRFRWAPARPSSPTSRLIAGDASFSRCHGRTGAQAAPNASMTSSRRAIERFLQQHVTVTGCRTTLPQMGRSIDLPLSTPTFDDASNVRLATAFSTWRIRAYRRVDDAVVNTGGTLISIAPGVYYNAVGQRWIFLRGLSTSASSASRTSCHRSRPACSSRH
jgi:hypothetical protein